MAHFAGIFALALLATAEVAEGTDVPNGGFEEGSVSSGFEQSKQNALPACGISQVGPDGASLPAWVGSGSRYIISSGNEHWGCTRAAEGQYFISLGGAGAWIGQNVSGHTAGHSYLLHYQLARRSGYSQPTIRVLADGVALREVSPRFSRFATYTDVYQASSEAVEIKFEDVSPGADDYAAFLDQVEIASSDLAPSHTAACTVTDGSSASSEYPCVCGSAVCTASRFCFAAQNWCRVAEPSGVLNGGFEEGSETCTHETVGLGAALPAWAGNGSVVFISSGSAVWGGTVAASGQYFLGLRDAGTWISQELLGHMPGRRYTLLYRLARHSGHAQPVVRVLVDGLVLREVSPELGRFELYSDAYVASSDVVAIKFENVGPGDSEHVAFIDQIELAAPCTVTDGSGVSEKYPCTCGSEACTANELCFESSGWCQLERSVSAEIEGGEPRNAAVLVVVNIFFFCLSVCCCACIVCCWRMALQPHFAALAPSKGKVFPTAILPSIHAEEVREGEGACDAAELLAVVNGGFEEGSATDAAEYVGCGVSLPGWTCQPENLTIGAPKIVLVRSGNTTWGGTSAAEGQYFIGLQHAGAWVSQQVHGHTPGQSYTLRYQLARRRGYPQPIVQVLVDGMAVRDIAPQFSRFTVYSDAYTASSEAVEIKFENVSPEGDSTVFIDQIEVMCCGKKRPSGATTAGSNPTGSSPAGSSPTSLGPEEERPVDVELF